MRRKPKYKNLQNDYETLEKQLLALFYSGVYISSFDLINIAKEIGYNLSFKERDILMGKIMEKARDDNRLVELLLKLRELLKNRGKTYIKLGNEHPYARDIIGIWLQKAKSTDSLLKREIILKKDNSL